MSRVHRKLKCPKCGDVSTSFSNLCYHMEHVHGMWYLSKNAKLTSGLSVSCETRKVPTTHSDNHRLRTSSHSSSPNDTHLNYNVELAIHKLSQSYSKLEDDVKLIFEELKKKNDFLKEGKDFRYSHLNDVSTSPILRYDGGGEVPASNLQPHPYSVGSKVFKDVPSVSPTRDKDTSANSVIGSSSGHGFAAFQILKVPKQYRQRNSSCPICRSDGIRNSDPNHTLISDLKLSSKPSHKSDYRSFPFLTHYSGSAHDDHCHLDESTMCKQLYFSHESGADSGKGDSVRSKATSAKVADTVESRSSSDPKHSGHRVSPELATAFSKKTDLSSGELSRENLVSKLFANCEVRQGSLSAETCLLVNTGSVKKPLKTKRGSNDISEDISPLELVLPYLSTNEVLTCRMVCRSWRQIAQQSCYYENLVISDRMVTSELLQSIAQSCCDTRFLTLKDLRGREKADGETTDEYLRKMRGTLEIGLEAILKSAGHMLMTLNIVACRNLLTERCLWLASCYSRELTQISYVSQLHPATAESLWALGSGCRKVHTLIIPPFYPSPQPERFSSRSLHMVAKCWPDLKILCVGGTEVGLDGLISIASNCHRLEVLELDHMGEVQEDAIISICKSGLKALQRIYFTHTPVTPTALLHLYSVCRHLTAISVIVNPSDYFVDPKYPPNAQEFENRILALKALLKEPGLPKVLKITVR